MHVVRKKKLMFDLAKDARRRTKEWLERKSAGWDESHTALEPADVKKAKEEEDAGGDDDAGAGEEAALPRFKEFRKAIRALAQAVVIEVSPVGATEVDSLPLGRASTASKKAEHATVWTAVVGLPGQADAPSLKVDYFLGSRSADTVKSEAGAENDGNQEESSFFGVSASNLGKLRLQMFSGPVIPSSGRPWSVRAGRWQSVIEFNALLDLKSRSKRSEENKAASLEQRVLVHLAELTALKAAWIPHASVCLYDFVDWLLCCIGPISAESGRRSSEHIDADPNAAILAEVMFEETSMEPSDDEDEPRRPGKWKKRK
jgi:hypothetical protein